MYVQSLSDWSLLTFPLKTELILNTHTIVADIHQEVSRFRDGIDGEDRVVSDVGMFSVT